MAYQITISTYELKANLSRYLRALHRGDCDAVIINRYGRPAALILSPWTSDKPALAPETQQDLSMRRRAIYVDTGTMSRRRGQD